MYRFTGKFYYDLYIIAARAVNSVDTLPASDRYGPEFVLSQSRDTGTVPWPVPACRPPAEGRLRVPST